MRLFVSKVPNKGTEKTLCYNACKEGQFDVVELMAFSINLNAQHVNG